MRQNFLEPNLENSRFFLFFTQVWMGIIAMLWACLPVVSAKPTNTTNTTVSKRRVAKTAPDPILLRAIQGIQRYYQEVQSLCADFQQVFRAARLSRDQKEQGKFFYRKPGKLRFLYHKPEAKDFIYNAELRTLWMYYPEDQEVKVHFNMEQSRFGVAMQFLWGSGDLQRSFRIRRIHDKTFGSKGMIQLELTPKTPQTILKTLFFAVDPKRYTIRETVYTDPAQNRNRFIFSRLRRNTQCTLKDTMFRFKRPAGVEQTIVGR